MELDPLALQASRARCVSSTWMTAPRTHATMGAAWMASPASPVPVRRATRARAVRVKWTSAAASLAATEANAWTWWTNTSAAALLAPQVGPRAGMGQEEYIWREGHRGFRNGASGGTLWWLAVLFPCPRCELRGEHR